MCNLMQPSLLPYERHWRRSESHLVRVAVELLHELGGLAQPDSWYRGEIVTAREDAHLPE